MLNEDRVSEIITASHRKPRGVWGFPSRVTGCPVLSKSVVALSHIENLIKKRSKNAHVLLMDSQDVDVMTNHIITLINITKPHNHILFGCSYTISGNFL